MFDAAEVEARYSLAMYHLQGSRILSRSFTLEKDADDDEAEAANTSLGSAMDVEGDAPHAHDSEEHGEEEEGEEGDEEDEDAGIVAMVPFADMLNARYRSENVRFPLLTHPASANARIHRYGFSTSPHASR